VIDLWSLQRALGGEISGGQVLSPGPGHSPRDRSLAVRPSPDGEGFIVHSHCGDDWQTCKDYVRERLGLPQWQPGDERERRVDPSRLKTFERVAVEAETKRRPLTQDDRVRIERARAMWDEATDPRGTEAERYLASRKLLVLWRTSAASCAITRVAPGATKTLAPRSTSGRWSLPSARSTTTR